MPERFEPPRFTWASERHLRLEIDATPTRDGLDVIGQCLHTIRDADVPGLINVTPTATTLLLEFDIDDLDDEKILESVQRAFPGAAWTPKAATSAIIEIPVCYDTSCAPDLADVARMHNITQAELIRLHSSPTYFVQFIGFVPGFGYLSGLPAQLNTPRLDVPRTRVPPGSVGIAGDQTGVYPGNTPGGWRLIGRTPLRMFDAGRERPSVLTRGDRVHFVPISLAEFNEQQRDPSNHG